MKITAGGEKGKKRVNGMPRIRAQEIYVSGGITHSCKIKTGLVEVIGFEIQLYYLIII